MGRYREIKGDLIKFAQEGHFDVIGHGCNCFCIMGAGIAPQMAKAFGCDKYIFENHNYKGNVVKLGNFESRKFGKMEVVNIYTQYEPGANLNYLALRTALKQLNKVFKGKHIGLPQIGCGIAGGDWNIVSSIIQEELKDCRVTIVIYDSNTTEYDSLSIWESLRNFVIKFIQ